jgi:transposase
VTEAARRAAGVSFRNASAGLTLLAPIESEEARVLTVEAWMDIKSLRRDGHSIKAIARLTGHSRNTVKRILREAGPQPFRSPQRESKLEPYKAYLRERFEQYGVNATRLAGEIRGMGYDGSVWTVRRFLESLRPERKRLARLTVRFETAPGRQAQVDWAYCGRFPNATGTLVPVYAFVMVLCFSRMLYVEFTRSMRIAWLLRCHLNAFAFFDGLVSEILYDNMSQVRLPTRELNPLFLDFAQHHGLAIKTHRVRRPRTKGKVERMVHYVKNGFLAGGTFADFDDLNAHARHWLATTANVRLHGTTERRPVDLWPEERLTPLSVVAPYRIDESVPRQAGYDGFVRFGRSRYSVPPEYAGEKVTIGLEDRRVVVRARDMIVAEHAAAERPGSCVAERSHLEAMWKLSVQRPKSTPPPRWQLTFDAAVQTTPLSAYEVTR